MRHYNDLLVILKINCYIFILTQYFASCVLITMSPLLPDFLSIVAAGCKEASNPD